MSSASATSSATRTRTAGIPLVIARRGLAMDVPVTDLMGESYLVNSPNTRLVWFGDDPYEDKEKKARREGQNGHARPSAVTDRRTSIAEFGPALLELRLQ